MIDDHIAEALAATARGDDEARWAHVRALQLDGSPDALRAAIHLCESGDPARRQLGADVLAQFSDSRRERPHREASAPVLTRLLHDPAAKVLASAALAHGRLSLEIAPDLLRSLAAHPSEEVRFALAIALPDCGGALTEPLLIQMMTDPADDVRNWATFGLGSMVESDSPEIREALLQRTADLHDETRGEALVGLARRGDRRVVEPLVRELRARSVGTLAVEAARDLGDPELLPDLEEISTWWDVDVALIAEALEACRTAR